MQVSTSNVLRLTHFLEQEVQEPVMRVRVMSDNVKSPVGPCRTDTKCMICAKQAIIEVNEHFRHRRGGTLIASAVSEPDPEGELFFAVCRLFLICSSLFELCSAGFSLISVLAV
ncbi:unnamed protein product, partial [Amoebophrya sp. A120]|eukprot:GSA120T00009618001.1